jgi:hypothetical protein
MRLEATIEADGLAVAAIYREGIATGHATFASAPTLSFASRASAGTVNGSHETAHSAG